MPTAPLPDAAADSPDPGTGSGVPVDGLADTPSYRVLEEAQRRIHRLSHLHAMAYWDRATAMPPDGRTARDAALAELSAQLRQLRTDPALHDRMVWAEQETLDPWQQANLREFARHWRTANTVPDALLRRLQAATARCAAAWRGARAANDWRTYADALREVVAVVREQATLQSYLSGERPYDVLLDTWEPGLNCARLDALFGALLAWLPGLRREVLARQRARPAQRPEGPFAPEAQQALGRRLLQVAGFDTARGAVGVARQAFTGGAPEDVRVALSLNPHDALAPALAALHEAGHARYQQGLPRAWLDQPLGMARSIGLHESQALLLEQHVGHHPGFVAQLSAWLVEAHGHQPAFEPANLRRLLTQVHTGPLRSAADPLSAPLHVLLRYRIERPLIEGEIEVDDIPSLWDAGMAELLDIDTRGDLADGPMQDVHWSEGLFGHFPSYALGSLYAAQFMAAARRELPRLDAELSAGVCSGLTGWLDQRVWRHGSRWPTDELLERATGEALNPVHLRLHLERRHLD